MNANVLFTIVCLLTSMVFQVVSVAAETKTATSPAAAWNENERKLGVVELTYKGLHTSKTTKREQSVDMDLGDGVQVKLFPAIYESNVTITSCADCTAIKSTLKDDSDSINFYDGKDWIEYRLGSDRRIKRRFDQLAGQPPYDPRWMFTHFNNISPTSMLTCAASDNPKESATYIPESQIDKERHNQVRLDFSDEIDGLPTSSSLWLVDRNTNVETKLIDCTLRYLHIKNRNAYVPAEISIQGFEDNVMTSETTYKLMQIAILEGNCDSVRSTLPKVSRLLDLTIK